MPNRYANTAWLENGLGCGVGDLVRPINALDAAVVALEDGTQGFSQFNFAAATELTIADGAVTITGSYHTIDTEEDAASDVLHTINGGQEGDVLYLRLANAVRTVTFAHGAGNLYLSNGLYYDLTSVDKVIGLFHNGTYWVDISITSGLAIETILGWTELASPAASVSISNIPATYKTLILRVVARTDFASTNDIVRMLLNDDTQTTNYRETMQQLYTNAVNSLAFYWLQVGRFPAVNTASGYIGCSEIVLQNVVADRPKPMSFRNYVFYSTDRLRTSVGGGLWLNTVDLINKISLQPYYGSNLVSDTAYALYGVK